MSDIKAELRARFLGKSQFRRERMTVDLGDGPVDVEIKQPSISERGDIVKKAGLGGNSTDLTKLQVAAVKALVYAPGGGRIFEDADEAALAEMPAGGWFDELAERCMKLINVSPEDSRKK